MFWNDVREIVWNELTIVYVWYHAIIQEMEHRQINIECKLGTMNVEPVLNSPCDLEESASHPLPSSQEGCPKSPHEMVRSILLRVTRGRQIVPDPILHFADLEHLWSLISPQEIHETT